MATIVNDETLKSATAVTDPLTNAVPPTVEEVLKELPHERLYHNKGLIRLYAVLIPGVLLCKRIRDSPLPADRVLIRPLSSKSARPVAMAVRC